ncbi:MAG: type-F conjugative transfer system protein TraW [Parachlamydiaceae bacterium]
MAYFLMIAFFFSPFLNAKDLGVQGHCFDISESSLLEYLLCRTKSLTDDEIEEINLEIQSQYASLLKRPKPTELPKRETYHKFLFDPSIVCQNEIKDLQGKVIIPKGTRYNPLDHVKLAEDLLLFDGDDSYQINWAKKQKGKWILTNGSPVEIEKQEARPVYFDQNGVIISKFGIDSVPARVSQKGKLLLIELVAKEEFECL